MGKRKKKESMFIQGVCIECNKNKQTSKGIKDGKRVYRATCRVCHKKKYGRPGKGGILKYKKNHCEKCNFIPKHSCQLDIDHVDGNHDNDLPENLQTLCANCHRLKTYLNKDWQN